MGCFAFRQFERLAISVNKRTQVKTLNARISVEKCDLIFGGARVGLTTRICV